MAEKLNEVGDVKFTHEVNCLLYVCGSGVGYKGWKQELLVEKIRSKLEEMFLLCSCCRGVLRDACMIERDGKQELRCSVCIPDNVYGSVAQMNREVVDEKQVHCPFKFKGCDWTDTIDQLFTHLRECGLFPIKCPLRCLSVEEEKEGEVNTVERGLLSEHQHDSCPMRLVNCDYCSARVTACEVNPHLQICEGFPLACPNSCGCSRVERRNMAAHLSSDCPFQVIECPFAQYGCDVSCKRAEMDQHVKELVYTHLNCTTLKVKTLQRELSGRDSEIRDLKSKISSLQVRGELEWKISGVQKKIENREVAHSDPFYVEMYKCQVAVLWDIKGEGNVGCIFYILKGEFDDQLTWPFRFECRFILLNQVNSEDNFIKSMTRAQEEIEDFEKPKEQREYILGVKFISHSEILTEKYLKDDCIFLRVPVLSLPAW